MNTTCEGPRRLKISWSALQAHELCAHRALRLREKKKSPAQDIRPFFHGTVADRCMRRWLESDDPQPGQMQEWLPEMVERCLVEARESKDGTVRWKHQTDRAEMIEWIDVLLGRLEAFLLRDVIPYDYEPEYKFRTPIRIPDIAGNTTEIDLVGAMDIRVRESEDPPVWAGYDLKATENPSYVNKTLGQGMFYSLAQLADQHVPFRTFGFVQPMVEKTPIVYVTVTPADLSSLLARITAMAHAIWRGDTAPKADNEGCGWCPVRHACTKFSPTSSTMLRPKRKSAA